MKEFQRLQDRIEEWSNRTFGENSSIEGLCAHLLEEMKHLTENPYSPEAHADVRILLHALERKAGYTVNDIYTAINAKMKINEARKWQEPDEKGIIRHK